MFDDALMRALENDPWPVLAISIGVVAVVWGALSWLLSE